MLSSSRPTVNDNHLKLSSINLIQHQRGAESLLKPINEEEISRLMREYLKNDSMQKKIIEIVKNNDDDVGKSQKRL
ncbi:unnamed protein product [Didymodactylos carnosus]|uniref:Uncharacterized protein n=1 Tax=Didymodactylos carnosus TaxID=1234261 RepID=A0A814ZPN1_9BILA|nr:unnamed protein product [Didymodactylos carnosus]CAF1656351.1 unnamed protein product [Didymodactylos carnosus]CAF4011726.1 unnamed protein product [Didymodactylos carnosus]CAF4509019.1 unnamed protein product [Didymodactylos carnosus]